MKKVCILSAVLVVVFCGDSYAFGRRQARNCNVTTQSSCFQSQSQSTYSQSVSTNQSFCSSGNCNLQSSVITNTATFTETTSSGGSSTSEQVLAIVNQYRIRSGLGILSHNETFASYSTSWSSKMRARGRLEHSSGFAPIGGSNEVCGMGQNSPDDIVRSWMNSPGHRSALMNPTARTLGAGNDGVAWTAVVGR